jgi:hypothetical protein
MTAEIDEEWLADQFFEKGKQYQPAPSHYLCKEFAKIVFHILNARYELAQPEAELVAVEDIDVEVAIAEAIAVMDSKTDYCETGVPVLKYLKHHGWVVMQSKRDADAIAEALNTIENR